MGARTIADLLARSAGANPDGVAIVSPGRAPLRYRDLHAELAAHGATLRHLGIASGDRVAVVLPNGPEMAVAFLAVATSAACAPLNPAAKEGELAFAMRDLGARALLVAGDGTAVAAIAAARALALPVLEACVAPGAPAGRFTLHGDAPGEPAPATAPRADDVALLLHTSGTTARPKLVPLSQRNLCASAENVARTLALGHDDLCLNVMPLFHIHGLVAALLASLAAGAGVACTPGLRAGDFAAWLRDLAPTWYTAVPTIHQAILEALGGVPAARGRLRFVRSSSAALPPPVLHELAAAFGVPVIEAYGMTEASHQMASNPLPPGTQHPGSVGPAAGAEIAVMDEAGRLLARGVVGELVVRGETVTTGYEANPDANASAFADGWFRTGDQGYVDDDGYVHLTGRLKELINRGGEKIAPREVEEALLRHPAVAQAVAFAVPHRRLGEEVAAAIVLRDGARATPDELRRQASDTLAYFKVPRHVAIVAEIPKGATGKVQRRGLAQALGLTERTGPDGALPPRTPLEESVATVWRRVLGVASLGIEDDFFALGGDSLAAAEMLSMLAERLDVEVPIADFLERPTIACLCALHERERSTGAPSGVVVIRHGGVEAPIFCTTAHDGRLWGVAKLARHLPIEAPVYGLPAPPVGAFGSLPTIAQLAAQNVEVLTRLQPHGPVRLIGPCFGGTVALEMAIQLEGRGRTVELLVMLNSFNRAWRATTEVATARAVRTRHLVERVRLHARRLRLQDRAARIAYLRSRAALVRAHWGDEARRLLFELATRSGLPRPRAVQKVAYASRHAQRRYVARPYSGRVLLVSAVAPIAGVYPLPHLGWADVLRGPTDLLELPCEQLEFWADDAVLREVALHIGSALTLPRGAGPIPNPSPCAGRAPIVSDAASRS